MSRVCLLALSALLACVGVYGDPVQGPDCSEFKEEYVRAIDCPYGIYNWTLNGCNRWKCKEDPCVRLNCTSREYCERIKRSRPNYRGDPYSAWCAPGPDCKPFQKECNRLQHCDLGIEKINGTDGCERCKCKQNPCKTIACEEGKRCVLQNPMPLNDQEPALYAKCITMVKAGACPEEETSPYNETCARECADDADCRGEGKCCRRGCGLLCQAPVALSSIPTDLYYTRTVPVSTHVSTPYSTLNIGSTLRLRCEVHGFPKPDIHWTKDGANYATLETSPIPSSKIVYDLTVPRVSVANSGLYTCHASNLYGSHSDSAQINVQGTVPVSTHVSTPFSTLNIGSTLNLTCEVHGFPKPDIYWTKDGAHYATVETDRIPPSTTITSLLTVMRVLVADSGLYACHASNPYGSHSDSAQINVQGSSELRDSLVWKTDRSTPWISYFKLFRL